MTRSEVYIQRCFDLARLGAGRVSPNPMVGAVLVCNDRIIGEGYHQAYGQAHAEVNALTSVKPSDKRLIAEATLYVSLEPCCIYGHTPPCTQLIIQAGIPRVVLASFDRTPGVNGKGVKQLREAGVQVQTGVLAARGNRLSACRNIFVTKERPYIILKYAQTADRFFARSDERPFWISNAFSKRLVHKWRSEIDAILVSGRTARLDNPKLTNRLYFGSSPQRIILDRRSALPSNLHIFDRSAPTIVVYQKNTAVKDPLPEVVYLPLLEEGELKTLLQALHQRKINALMVEGGARLLQSFIDQDLWDEARVFQSKKELLNGVPAPALKSTSSRQFQLGSDRLYWHFR